MKISRLLAVTRLNISRDLRGFFLSAAGVAAGTAAFFFFVGLGEGVSNVVREKIFPVDVGHIRVIPPRISLGAFLGGGVLDDETVERLASFPGVVSVYRQLELNVPAVSQYSGDFFGRRIRMGVDIIGLGVDEAYIIDHLPEGSKFRDPDRDSLEDGVHGDDAVIPVVISKRLIELYNTTFAPVRNLPVISENQLIGFRFPLTLGASYISRPGIQRRTTMLEVAGISDRGVLLGVTLPLETVQRWNKSYATDKGKEKEGFSAVILVADDPGSVQEIMNLVRGAGFDVDRSAERMADEIGAAVRITTLALALLSFLILAVAAISIARAAYAHVASRIREIGVMRAVGASRKDIGSIVLAEAAAAGLAGGISGLIAGFTGILVMDYTAANYVADFPFKPDSFFVIPLWLPFTTVASGLFFSVLGSVLPAYKASKTDPVIALSGGS